MTLNAPAAVQPVTAAVLKAVLLNFRQDSVLVLGQPPQALTLELRNPTRHDLTFSAAQTRLLITFRPGVLIDAGKIVTNNADWGLTPGGTQFPMLTLTPAQDVTIAPGDTLNIALDGFSPSAAGGSRSTRADLEFSDLSVGQNVLSGRRTLHLSLLDTVTMAPPAVGQSGTAGPITALLRGSADVIPGTRTNIVQLSIATTRDLPVTAYDPQAVPPQDDLPKVFVYLPFHKGGSLKVAASFNDPHWTPDSPPDQAPVIPDLPGAHVIKLEGLPAGDTFAAGTIVTVDLEITTNLPPGIYPLRVLVEDVNTHSFEMSVMIHVTAFGLPGIAGTDGFIAVPGLLDLAGALKIGGSLSVGPARDGSNIGADEVIFGSGIRAGSEQAKDSSWFYIRNKGAARSTFYARERDHSVEVGANLTGKSMNLVSPLNVGINQPDPQYTLDVNGAMATTGISLTADDGTLKFNNGNFIGVQAASTTDWFYFRNKAGLSTFYVEEFPGHIAAGSNVAGKPFSVISDKVVLPGGWSITATDDALSIEKAGNMIFYIDDKGVIGGNASLTFGDESASLTMSGTWTLESLMTELIKLMERL